MKAAKTVVAQGRGQRGIVVPGLSHFKLLICKLLINGHLF